MKPTTNFHYHFVFCENYHDFKIETKSLQFIFYTFLNRMLIPKSPSKPITSPTSHFNSACTTGSINFTHAVYCSAEGCRPSLATKLSFAKPCRDTSVTPT